MHSLTLPPFHHFRSQDLWEDPLKYNPDRWSKAFHNDKVEGWKGFRPEKISGLYPDEQATDFAFLPFGGGARKVRLHLRRVLVVDSIGLRLCVDAGVESLGLFLPVGRIVLSCPPPTSLHFSLHLILHDVDCYFALPLFSAWATNSPCWKRPRLLL